MTRVGQCCFNVADLERGVAFYSALGLECASRTEIEQAYEAVMANDAGGGRLQLAQQKGDSGPIDVGTALLNLYVNTDDVASAVDAAVAAGATRVTDDSVRDLDGYLVSFVQGPGSPPGTSVGPYCINVSDLDATVGFYELAGLSCSGRAAGEATVGGPDGGGQFQLAHRPDTPVRMGGLWKLYVYVDDCAAVYDALVAAGHPSIMVPTRLDRWPVTVAFVEDPDGYQVELVQRH